MFDISAAAARWARIRETMARLDLDLLIAVDLSRDEILTGSQRWITGYIPVGGPAAALVHRGGAIELISDRIGKPVTEHYRANGFPIELVGGFSPQLITQRIARYAPKRMGFAEPDSFSAAIADAVKLALPGVVLVNASTEVLHLRMRKSADEIALIRKSSAIADETWEHLPDIFKVGRANYEIVADINHLVSRQGAEGGFHLVLPLPFLGRAMQSIANPEPIRANARYLVEISPRFQGYYSQLTIPVSTIPDDREALQAYEDVVEAKRAAQPQMRPGADLSQVAESTRAFLATRGRTMASLSLGHFCGMALEEPRHDPAMPMILEKGMTLIFHPVLADPAFHSLMRADTYLVTDSGAEKLNLYRGGMLLAP